VAASQGFEKHLVREGVVDEDRLEKARAEARKVGGNVVDVLVQTGVAPAEALYRSLADFCEMRYVAPSKMELEADLSTKVPARFANHYEFVPIQERNGTLVVAVSDPLNNQRLDDIRMVLKRRIEPCVTTPREVEQGLKALYGVGSETVDRMMHDGDGSGDVVNLDREVTSADLGDENIDASIIKFVNEIFSEAIAATATDIHIEPFDNELRVRYRIDGVLHAVPVPPNIRGFHAAIVSRVKIMANLNIAERRLPQDGKIRATLGDDQFDLRVSILPTPYGETVNLRILNRGSMFMTLEQLGFPERDLKRFTGFIERPHGMILVTGPTGSGKTTTLYAALSRLNSLDRKIITIEDPIEYQLHGITQTQVMPQIGFGFTQALRSMLRHDPDIMLVGEIRDQETAEMAVRSSLTGHLVFSTLHTNDAAGAITRLEDLGLEPFLIGSTMIASIAQRLVRRVCPDCAEDYRPDEQAFIDFGLDPSAGDGGSFRRGAGCDNCRHTGYRGRMAIYEILPFSGPVKELISQDASPEAIRRKAADLGMRSLRDSGWERVWEGHTTFEEVMRVTADADLGA
jgi:type II secretion system protein E